MRTLNQPLLAYHNAFICYPRNVETLEKIPNIDHYRNVMSIVGAMHSRPTLAELHEDKELPDDLEMAEMDQSEVIFDPKLSHLASASLRLID